MVGEDILLCEGAVQEPGDDREILALIESGKNDRVDIFLGGWFCRRHGKREKKLKAVVRGGYEESDRNRRYFKGMMRAPGVR